MKINDALSSLLLNHHYDDQQLFEIQSLKNVVHRSIHENLQDHKQLHYRIIWVTKGSGEHFIDIKRNELKNNHIYFVLPQQVQVIKANHDLDGYMISFTGNFLGLDPSCLNDIFFSGKFNSFTDLPVIEINNELKNDILHIVLKMKKEFNEYANLRMDMLREYLKLLLIYLNRHISTTKQTGERLVRTETVNKFYNLVHEHFKSKKMVTEYADMLAVSPSHLNNMVKKASGHTASHHIQQQIILEAKRQAMFTDKSMKEIAFQLGFEEKSHFSKFFKKIEGHNFSNYRKSIDKNLYFK